MATPRKAAAVDPLKEELPPEPEEPKPTQAEDIKFEVEIDSYVVLGDIFYRWTITTHNAVPYIGSYAGHSEGSFGTAAKAEANVTEYVNRIRHTVALKLTKPDTYRITI